MFRALRPGFVAVFVLTTAVAADQERVQLVRTPKAGTTLRYQVQGRMDVTMNGATVLFELKGIDRYAIKAVAANGDVTLINDTESATMSMNGQPTEPDQSMFTPNTIVTRKDNSLISITGPNGPELDDGRLFYATHIVFSDKPVGVGDKWTRNVAADAAHGVAAGTGTYEVVAFEKVGAIDTVKIQMTFQEKDGASPVKATCTFWVERATGADVKADGRIENFPPVVELGGSGALELHMVRIGG